MAMNLYVEYGAQWSISHAKSYDYMNESSQDMHIKFFNSITS